MMKKLLAGLFCLVFVGSGYADQYTRLSNGGWSDLSKWRNHTEGQSATNFPGAGDTILLNAGRVLTVDTNAVAGTIVAPNAPNSSATLILTNSAVGKTLTATAINIGIASQVNSQGYMYQSDGTVNAGTVNVYGSGTGSGTYNLSGGTLAGTTLNVGDAGTLNQSGGTASATLNVGVDGIYNLTGGTLNSTVAKDVTVDGTLAINGGTLSQDLNSSNDVVEINGSGVVHLQSGLLQMDNGINTSVVNLRADLEISGGTLDLSGQIRTYDEMKVVGDAAAIQLDRIGAQTSSFVFELGADGVSTVNSAGGYQSLAPASLRIDGANYVHGGGTFTNLLFKSSNLNTLFDPGNVTITNFADGLTVNFFQDQSAGKEYVGIEVVQESIDPLQTVLALGNLTNAPTMFADDASMTTTNVNAGELNAIYFDALDYNGLPTRVYAYVGLPAGASSNSPVPGVVLVHGGGGTAFDEWVELWTNRGYAAISIAVEGQTDSTALPTMNTGWHIHNMPGPVRDGIYGDSDEALTNQWMYHAVADTVLANSLLRSLPEVVSTNVGVMGISWGGVITSTAIGIDDRFRFAVPTYGCGSLATAENQYGVALGDNDLYKEVWDPMVRITNVTMPVMWFSWPEDEHFPMESLADCYTNAPGPHMVSLVPGMTHGHSPAWNRPESYAFADSITSNGTPWCVQQSVGLSNDVAEVVFTSSKILDQAKLVSTLNVGFTGDRTWNETSAMLVANGGGAYTVTATLPEYTTAWFINGLSGTLVASSDYQETDEPPPSNVVYNATAHWSSKTVNGNDAVTITNSATVTFDQDEDAASLTVADGILQMDQNHTLSLSGPLAVDVNGIVNLNTGAVASEATSLFLDGTMEINGGTFSRVTTGTGYTVTGGGALRVLSGLLAFTGGAATDVVKLNTDVEIRGGTIDLDGQIYVGNNVATEFKVVGSDAAINIERLNQGLGGDSGTFRFVLDETGVSTVQVSAWMGLENLSIEVDGSAYTGGATNLLLLDSVNLSSEADTNNVSVTGFAEHGLSASIVQDPTDGKDWVQLVIVSQYDTWADGFGLGGTNALSTANPDGDPLSNLYEYGLGGDPTNSADIGHVPSFEPFDDGGTNGFEYVYARRKNSGLNYWIETSANLVPSAWINSGYTELPMVGTIDSDFESVTNRLDTAGKTNEFVRLFIDEL